MPTPSIYINLEDDVSKIVARLKREKSSEVVLVCPKRCFLFSDAINLRLLKKQVDLLGKQAAILTMDERGQQYAREAGFALREFPRPRPSGGMSDIRPGFAPKSVPDDEAAPVSEPAPVAPKAAFASAVAGLKKAVQRVAPHAGESAGAEMPFVAPPSVAVQAKAAPAAAALPRQEAAAAMPSVRKSKTFGRFAVFMLLVSLVLIAALVLVILPKAEVVVYPKTEPITRDIEVSISTNIQKPDATALVLPATAVNKDAQADGTFESQGKKPVGNKAVGTVKIYNFTQLPINLKANTTILTIGDKNYLLAQDVNGARPTVYKNPSTKEVDESTLAGPYQVIAETGGESFNVPAGTRLEINNQVFGSRPQVLFAKADTPITGGTTRYLSVVTDQDLADAQSKLGTQALGGVQDQLKQQGLIMPDQAYAVSAASFAPDQPAGTESPSFKASLAAKVAGIAFKEGDMKSTINERISQTLSANEHLDEASAQYAYSIKSVDLSRQMAVILVHFEGKAVYGFNLGDVRSELVGKTKSQANEILRSKAEVDEIDITLAPSWQNTFPWFVGKIDVKVAE